MTTVKLHRELASLPYEIPDGSMPVGTRQVADRPSTVLLSFPPGWQREQAGHFADAEEFIVLSGAVAMNEEVHRAGTWVLVPGRSARWGTRTPEGALAIAWFDGRGAWTSDDGTSPGRSLHVDLARASRTHGTTPWGPGRQLRRRRSWWVTQLNGGPTDVLRQVVTTGTDGAPQLVTAEVGQPMPAVEGPCFVRTERDVR